MTSNYRYIWIILCLSLFLCGCSAQSQEINLAICGSYAVPGMFCWDLKGNSFTCNILEQDKQGRILYTYSTENVITQKSETATVVCQATDSKFVYYYEDVCFIFGEPTAEQIDALKQKNDWNCELNHERMVKKSCQTSLDMNLAADFSVDHANLLSVCRKEFKIEEAKIKELCFIGSNSSDKGLYWLVLQREYGDEKYFLITDNSYEISYMHSDGTLESIAEIPTFKQQSGWIHGKASINWYQQYPYQYATPWDSSSSL